MLPLFTRWTEWVIATLFLLGCIVLMGAVLALDRLASLLDHGRRHEEPQARIPPQGSRATH